MKIAFYTLGCKVNQYETQALKEASINRGWQVVGVLEHPDAFVVNSCTVTAVGDKKARQAVRRFKRENPASIVALTGCFPQASPQIQHTLLEADVITGENNRRELLDLIDRAFYTGSRMVRILPHDPSETIEPLRISRFEGRTRAFVKIEDGCDRYCSYCMIPKARGPIRSKPLGELKEELLDLAQNGYTEVVLSGVNLSSYGKDLGCRLVDAVHLAGETPGVRRVRLSSLEPELLTPQDLLALAREETFCPHFHLSLQSGSDSVLRRMNRRYTKQQYLNLVRSIRDLFPNPAITTDIMVGFPGETEQEFEESLAFVGEVGFARAHVFPYSVRPGTKAASMPCQLSHSQKQQRAREMSQLARKSSDHFLRSQIGKTARVLFEERAGNDCEGYTENYLKTRVVSKKDLSGEIKCVKIIDVTGDRLIAVLV